MVYKYRKAPPLPTEKELNELIKEHDDLVARADKIRTTARKEIAELQLHIRATAKAIGRRQVRLERHEDYDAQAVIDNALATLEASLHKEQPPEDEW
jgi:hypothetical protein